jgi:two-component system, response regulator PdtaR
MHHPHVKALDRGPGRRWRVAVLDPHAASRARLVSTVAEVGVEVTVAGLPGQDVVPLIRQTGSDAVLLALGVPDDSTLLIASEIGCPVVLCSENAGADMVSAAQRSGAMAFLVKPLRTEQIVPTLALAISRFREGQSLRRALAERKIIERAKGQLMALQGMTEEDAFRWLRRRAMDTRLRIVDVARQVLSTSVDPMPSRGDASPHRRIASRAPDTRPTATA